MRLCFNTDGLGYMPFEEMLDTLAGLGYESVEIACGNWSKAPHINLDEMLESADARNAQKRLERLRAEATRIENEIDAIDERIAGEAAYDYKLLSELEEKKNALEERLLEIYEEI